MYEDWIIRFIIAIGMIVLIVLLTKPEEDDCEWCEFYSEEEDMNRESEANSLLRSAHAIAERKGKDTNWDAFIKNLEVELAKQAGIYPNDKPNLKRACCTPLTYRLGQCTNMDPSLDYIGG